MKTVDVPREIVKGGWPAAFKKWTNVGPGPRVKDEFFVSDGVLHGRDLTGWGEEYIYRWDGREWVALGVRQDDGSYLP